MSQHTISRLRSIAKEQGVEVCEEIWTGETPEETRFEKAPGILTLEQNLFRYPVCSYEGVPTDISIHVLKQPEKEVTFAAEQIRELLVS